MITYVINGREVEAEKELTENEIDEIASLMKNEEEVSQNIELEKKGVQPSVVVGIPGAGIAIPTTAQRTQEQVDQELEARVEENAKSKDEIEPTKTQIAAGLAAEISIAEGGKIAGTATGAKAALAIGQVPPLTLLPEEFVTVPGGAGLGYVAGALIGGASGSIARQKIEGRNSINWGDAAVSALLNLVPGSKITKGPKALVKATEAMAKRPVATTATVGALGGAAMETGTSLYETGELPDAGDVLSSAAFAGTFGAGIGLTSEKAVPLIRRFAGKSPKEINNLVNKGDTGAIAYVDAMTAGVDPSEFINSTNLKQYVGTLADTAAANIAPSKVLGPKATQAIRDANNIAMAGPEIGGVMGSRINDAIASSPNPDATSNFALEYLTGATDKVPAELESLASDLSTIRKHFKEYQDGILEMDYNGQRKLPELLKKKIEDSRNKGDYVTQSYAFFGDKDYSPSAETTKELLDDLTTRPRTVTDTRKFLRKTTATGERIEIENPNFGLDIETKPMSKAEAEKYIADLNQKKADNPDDVHNWVYSQNAGILKERKDLSPALRKYLGEYTEPGQIISNTYSKMSRLVAYDRADSEISNALREMGILKLAGEGVENLQPIKLRRGVAHIGDQELYGPPEVQTAINHLYSTGVDDKTMSQIEKSVRDLWQTSVSTSKAAKTVFNPVSYSTNFLGNTANMIGMGMNPFIGGKTGMKFAASQFEYGAKKLSLESLEEFKRKKELGLIPPGLTFADIQVGLKSGGIGRAAQSVIAPVGKLYSAPDVALRISAAKNYESQLLKQFPGADYSAVERQAADFTNNTFQNYDYVNNGIKTLSRYGVPLSQFATFTFELARNQYNQGKLIKKMLDGSYGDELSQKFGVPANQKEIRIEAAKRIAGLATVYAGVSAGAMQTMESLGVDREKEKAYRETVLPEYGEKGPLMIRPEKDGKINWMNMSYLAPQQQLIGPFIAGFNNRPFAEAMQYGLSGIADDVIGEGSFTMNALTQAVNNYNMQTGDQISTSPVPTRNKLERADFFIKETIVPQLIPEIEKAKTRDPRITAERLVGLRWNETSIEKGFGFKARQIKDAINTSKAEISFANNRVKDNKMTPEVFNEIYSKNNNSYRQNIEVLSKHVKNLRTLNKSDDDIIKMLRDNGIGSEIALNAVDGVVNDAPRIKPNSSREEYEQLIEGVDPNRIISKIKDIEDPVARTRMLNKHKEVVKNSRLKINERDKAIKTMGINDGDRARFIFGEMQRSQDPDGVYKKYMNKGMIPGPVALTIQQLKKNAQESY